MDGDVSTNVLNDIVIKHMADGGSWKDQQKKYDDHVEVALSQDLSIPRNQFYLAQSLRAASRFHEAIIEYKKRIDMKDGWYQEAVYSQLMIARLEHTLGETNLAILDYMKCYEMDSERWEALSELVGLLRKTGNFHLGFVFGKELMKMSERPQNKLFLEEYNNANTLLEYGLCAYYSKQKKIAKNIWTRAIRMKNIPENVKTTLKENMKWVN
jgi:tetratricopeptide (TPR) repeat protein